MIKCINRIVVALAVMTISASAESSCTDDEIKAAILGSRGYCCGSETGASGHDGWWVFDRYGNDTNRIMRLAAELSQTNDVVIARRMMRAFVSYGTAADMPFLYSCATNPICGGGAVQSIFRIEGIAENSLAPIRGYFSLASLATGGQLHERNRLCADLFGRAQDPALDASLYIAATNIVFDFAKSETANHAWLDELLMNRDGGYRYSRRRLDVLRTAWNRGGLNDYQANYVTNAINELVSYPESDLPE